MHLIQTYKALLIKIPRRGTFPEAFLWINVSDLENKHLRAVDALHLQIIAVTTNHTS